MREIRADTVPLSARKCRECGRGHMNTLRGDYKGTARWLCWDCLSRYRYDYMQKMGKFMPNRIVDDMLRF
jgi:transposase-like protein